MVPGEVHVQAAVTRHDDRAAGGLGSYVLAAACMAAGVVAIAAPSGPGRERVLHWACGAILLLLGVNRILVTRWSRRRAGRDPRWSDRDA